VLVGDFTEKVATLLDPARRGEDGTVQTCRGFVSAGSFQVVGATAAISIQDCNDRRYQTLVADMPDLEIVATIPDAYGQDLSLSPDGTRVAAQKRSGSILGPLRIYDARSAQELVDIEGICDWDADLFPLPREEAGPTCRRFPDTPFGVYSSLLEFSPDGRTLMLRDDPGIAIWDADSGALIKTLSDFDFDHDRFARSAIFTPDSKQIIVNVHGEILGVSTSAWTITRRGQLDTSLYNVGAMTFLGFLPNGTLIAMEGAYGKGGGSLLWIDPDDAEVQLVRDAHVGSPKSGALSPDGTRIVTGASDGVVRVWDAGTGDLLHEFRVSGQAQGVAFLGDDRVAVTPENGNILVFLLNPKALVDAARASLTRSFTPEECERFGFGDACPTLGDLRGGSAENGG
jgi:WD40 repeat protein